VKDGALRETGFMALVRPNALLYTTS